MRSASHPAGSDPDQNPNDPNNRPAGVCSLIVHLDPDNDAVSIDLTEADVDRLLDEYKVYGVVTHSQGVDHWLLSDGDIRIEQRVF